MGILIMRICFKGILIKSSSRYFSPPPLWGDPTIPIENPPDWVWRPLPSWEVRGQVLRLVAVPEKKVIGVLSVPALASVTSTSTKDLR